VIIEPLQRDKHHRLGFTCGKEPLDRFLHEYAHQAATKGLSKTYVAVREDDEATILGYYTLTTIQVEAGEIPREISRKLKLPKHTLPASLIARLATSQTAQGQGIGRLMLFDAMARCARVAQEIGGVAIIVDAIEESVVSFYEALGFVRFEPGELKLFLPMATVRELLGVA
jgi:GNAT superfamily N-acetyltransferase